MGKEKFWNRCIYCGKFISISDMKTDKIGSNFTPDSFYTTEKLEFYHKSCQCKE